MCWYGKQNKKTEFTVIDLFAGAGGLSEGFLETNSYRFLAHVEWEIPMVNTLRYNLTHRWGYNEKDAERSVVHFDIQKTNELIEGSRSKNTLSLYGNSNSDKMLD